MKILSFTINIILLIAVAILYYLHFSECDNSQTAVVSDQPRMITNSNNSESKASVVYVNSDTLLAQYKLAQQLSDRLFKRKQSLESDFEVRMSAFEKDYKRFVEKAQRGGFLTSSSEENQRRILLEQQSELDQLQESLSQQFYVEQQELNEQLFDSVSTFLEDYNQKYNYQYILNHIVGGNILHANENLDITEVVIEGLNRRYDAGNTK